MLLRIEFFLIERFRPPEEEKQEVNARLEVIEGETLVNPT